MKFYSHSNDALIRITSHFPLMPIFIMQLSLGDCQRGKRIRRMRFPAMRVVIAMAVCVLVAACEKSSARFHTGDRVRVKLTHTEGVVWLRLRPFADYLYFIKAPGSDGYYLSERPRHIEGPYHDADLEATP